MGSAANQLGLDICQGNQNKIFIFLTFFLLLLSERFALTYGTVFAESYEKRSLSERGWEGRGGEGRG